jgi:hypothetical protein
MASRAASKIPLDLAHTKCGKCYVWSRRPDRCPNCGAHKQERSGELPSRDVTVKSGKIQFLGKLGIF